MTKTTKQNKKIDFLSNASSIFSSFMIGVTTIPFVNQTTEFLNLSDPKQFVLSAMFGLTSFSLSMIDLTKNKTDVLKEKPNTIKKQKIPLVNTYKPGHSIS